MKQKRKDEQKPGRSVMDNPETFEHGSRQSEMTRGMSSSSERGMGSSGERGHLSDGSSGRQSGSGISNRGSDRDRDEQSRLPERGRSQSEE
jgi:hypothetical protein